MLWLASLLLALNDANGNTTQSKSLNYSLRSAFYIWSAVYILASVCILPLVHSLQSAFLYSLIENLQKLRLTGRERKQNTYCR